MILPDKIRQFENFHILLWLIKDTCWMLEVKWLGALMVAPTLLVALYIAIKTYGTPELFLNLAIFFWICANGFWMLMEFFMQNQHKNFAGIPFSLGFICVGIYYALHFRAKNKTV